jgi:SpoVK/Ycf46/Vps4 family AAA+-type ATPase
MKVPLAEIGARVTPRATWDDLVLPIETLAALREVAETATTHETMASQLRVALPSACGPSLMVLLAGPCGTCKTLVAEVLAGALSLDLFRVDLTSVVSKWIGETEKNLARVFDAAASSGAVLFFDELDTLLRECIEASGSRERYANVELAYLLQKMEGHSGLSILATKLRANLDQAFLRRMGFVIDLPFPDEAARRALWERHLPKQVPLAADVNFDTLSLLGLPGSAIRNVVLKCVSLAMVTGEPITMTHLQTAARREVARFERCADL